MMKSNRGSGVEYADRMQLHVSGVSIGVSYAEKPFIRGHSTKRERCSQQRRPPSVTFSKNLVTDVRFIPAHDPESLADCFYTRKEIKRFKNEYKELLRTQISESESKSKSTSCAQEMNFDDMERGRSSKMTTRCQLNVRKNSTEISAGFNRSRPTNDLTKQPQQKQTSNNNRMPPRGLVTRTTESNRNSLSSRPMQQILISSGNPSNQRKTMMSLIKRASALY